MHSIRGTTDKCVAHLAKAIAGRDFLKKRQQLANFLGVSEGSVHRWFSTHTRPVGEGLIRLRFYLEFLGYEVEEVKSMSETIRNAARLYAFGVTSLAETAELLGYQGKDANDTLIKVFRGMRGVSSERLKQMASYVDLYGNRLEEKKRTTPKVLHMTVSEQPSQLVTERPGTSVAVSTASHVAGNKLAVIESFAGLITAMLPLAEYVLSDSFTADERERVRELASHGGDISRLSNLFTQLSGEAVRTVLTNSSKKEAVQ